jgi:RES domain-containing protein
MRLWRISEWTTLDGEGGKLFGGRWNHAGHPIVYMAESSALAILEVLVWQPRSVVPPPFQLLEIHAPDDVAVTHWPADQDHRDKRLTADWGDAFLRVAETPFARVPSAVAPQSWNYLLNPLHPEAARVELIRAGRWPWDARLFVASSTR